ncbi:hypothetical protein M8C21_026583 [Ambrosia artemisiifolia]|uniref:Uncharacterized protein n=1 Tax=Ambrosia artemisiifolia TaxID=4212 RepID=A0AAD5GGQ3_AMBAR|nr:hypothetical protein M8C21_026583 [Ambrosia artemisiifolia]
MLLVFGGIGCGTREGHSTKGVKVQRLPGGRSCAFDKEIRIYMKNTPKMMFSPDEASHGDRACQHIQRRLWAAFLICTKWRKRQADKLVMIKHKGSGGDLDDADLPRIQVYGGGCFFI